MSTKQVTTCDVCGKTMPYSNSTFEQLIGKLLKEVIHLQQDGALIKRNKDFPLTYRDICKSCQDSLKEGFREAFEHTNRERGIAKKEITP